MEIKTMPRKTENPNRFWHRIIKYKEHPEEEGSLLALSHPEPFVVKNLSEFVELQYLGEMPKTETDPEKVVAVFGSQGDWLKERKEKAGV